VLFCGGCTDKKITACKLQAVNFFYFKADKIIRTGKNKINNIVII
jgi:hypothetical protein